jgi:hypothetical protein
MGFKLLKGSTAGDLIDLLSRLPGELVTVAPKSDGVTSWLAPVVWADGRRFTVADGIERLRELPPDRLITFAALRDGPVDILPIGQAAVIPLVPLGKDNFNAATSDTRYVTAEYARRELGLTGPTPDSPPPRTDVLVLTHSADEFDRWAARQDGAPHAERDAAVNIQVIHEGFEEEDDTYVVRLPAVPAVGDDFYDARGQGRNDRFLVRKVNHVLVGGDAAIVQVVIAPHPGDESDTAPAPKATLPFPPRPSLN